MNPWRDFKIDWRICRLTGGLCHVVRGTDFVAQYSYTDYSPNLLRLRITIYRILSRGDTETSYTEYDTGIPEDFDIHALHQRSVHGPSLQPT